ncbi:O-antigen ligase family protein [Naasia lichenicola]|uniref:O-antigen ligase family protein n=1 Tax=Naasia lichenicola TaxID=2565933 RepID=A0A4S4FP34_9MICO|nr:O-antigen ligase family protein [Naasia lichenicola]THG30787.1 O-antigen ligase family protein [Naasia lichenicola]THG32024.1 O-antigen ligase family protein [Naasia lichenicola]
MATRTAAYAYAILAFFTLFAGEAIRNTFSWYGYAGWIAVMFVGCVVVFAQGVRAGRQVEGDQSRASIRPLRGLLDQRKGAAFGRLWPAAVVLLGAYIVWAIVSLAWSAYPLGTLTGIAALLVVTFVAVTLVRSLGWIEIARALAVALTVILALSLLFEIIVAAVARRPILPVFPIDVVPGQKIPDAFYWSRALLFEGGRIQGIVGNANLLGFIALLALILCGCLLAAGALPRWLAISGLALATLELVLTRSSTVIAATVTTVLVLALGVLLRRGARASRAVRRRVGSGVIALLLVGVVVALIQYRSLLAIMGKSDDLTGRFDIWSTVGTLFLQRPVVGWGWIGYWLPWIAPFDHLAERRGVVYLQAHNAFLDVAFQLGVVGLILFIGLIIAIATRIGRGELGSADASASTVGVLLPALLLTALLTQALAESRLLYEGNWALLGVLVLASAAPLAQSRARPDDAAVRLDESR